MGFSALLCSHSLLLLLPLALIRWCLEVEQAECRERGENYWREKREWRGGRTRWGGVGWGGDWGSGVYFCAIQLGMPSHVGCGPGGEFARRTRTHDTDTHPVAAGGLVSSAPRVCVWWWWEPSGELVMNRTGRFEPGAGIPEQLLYHVSVSGRRSLSLACPFESGWRLVTLVLPNYYALT